MQGRRDIPLSGAGARRSVAPPEDLLPHGIESAAPRGRSRRFLGGSVGSKTLIEMDWGAWEGQTLADLRAAPGMEFERNEALGLDFRPPGGESPREVRERVRPWLARAATSSVPIVAVTHLGVLRVIVAAATGWDMTGKPPIRLRADALHRFAVDAHGQVSIVRQRAAHAREGNTGLW
jgi:probable phosphoglycerate mutase